MAAGLVVGIFPDADAKALEGALSALWVALVLLAAALVLTRL